MRQKAALGVIALLAVPLTAYADGGAATRGQGPCAGCLSSLPAGTEPRPLLVLLHGDGETAAGMLDTWGPAAAARGIVVFAPTCPRSEGCAGQSWWKWDGPPSWLLRQIDGLAETGAIDRERMWIAGWSGGGTYIGWNTQELERTFAALVIHGGGVQPRRSACSEPKAAIYFLGGDQNPLHSLTDPLHDYYIRCGHEDMTWTVLKGVDHQGERRALATRMGGILDWLETKRVTAAVAPALSEAGAPAVAAASTGPDSGAFPPPETPPRPPPAASSCHCAAAGAGEGGGDRAVGAAAVLVSVLVKRRRQGSRRRTPFTRYRARSRWKWFLWAGSQKGVSTFENTFS